MDPYGPTLCWRQGCRTPASVEAVGIAGVWLPYCAEHTPRTLRTRPIQNDRVCRPLRKDE